MARWQIQTKIADPHNWRSANPESLAIRKLGRKFGKMGQPAVINGFHRNHRVVGVTLCRLVAGPRHRSRDRVEGKSNQGRCEASALRAEFPILMEEIAA